MNARVRGQLAGRLASTVAATLAGTLWGTSAVLVAGAAAAQSVTTEAVVTAGASTDNLSALAAQLRAFGDTPLKLRYYAEAAWARDDGAESDAFGSAYPYGGRLQIIEAYGERMFSPGRALLGVRAGRYRVPFGLFTTSDHGYTGFLRAPLMRYDGYFALSNNFLEHGVDVVTGVPRLTVEASVGTPADVGEAVRRPGVDAVVRVQAALGPAIVGVSHIRTQPYQPRAFAFGNAEFSGIDARWMHDGIQLRGEWIGGRPFDGTTTTGWYADAIVHHVGMGPVTAVARVEKLDYDTIPRFALHAQRQTVGARVRVFDRLSAQLNVLHQTHVLDQSRATTLDVALTYAVRSH